MNATPSTLALSSEKIGASLPPPKAKNYYPNLDSIRGIAIIMVVIFHAFSFPPNSPLTANINRFLTIFSQGVPLFFILSGYLIASIIFGNPESFTWGNYLLRRVAKIVPPFLLSLGFYSLLEVKQGHGHGLWVQILGNLLTLPNFYFPCRVLNPVTWSLFVEIHFYLVLPLLFFTLRRVIRSNPDYWCIAIFFSLASIFRAATWFMVAASPAERFHWVSRFPNCLDYFAWGMFFASLSQRNAGHILSAKTSGFLARVGLLGVFVIIGVCTAELILFNTTGLHDNAFTSESCRLMVCTIAFLMLFGARVDSGVRIMENRALQYIGLISYEWFLFHLAIIPWVRYHVGVGMGIPYGIQNIQDFPGFLITTGIAAAVSFVVAAAVYHSFSQPLLKMLRR